jgi:hypothetical protein
VIQDCFDLGSRDARKPLEKVVNRRAILEILEEGADRDSGPPE